MVIPPDLWYHKTLRDVGFNLNQIRILLKKPENSLKTTVLHERPLLYTLK
jgi:DNA-binding transcriptional MerR regulator